MTEVQSPCPSPDSLYNRVPVLHHSGSWTNLNTIKPPISPLIPLQKCQKWIRVQLNFLEEISDTWSPFALDRSQWTELLLLLFVDASCQQNTPPLKELNKIFLSNPSPEGQFTWETILRATRYKLIIFATNISYPPSNEGLLLEYEEFSECLQDLLTKAAIYNK